MDAEEQDGSEREIRRTSDGGLSGSHGAEPDLEAPVAPATSNELNSIVVPVRPVACWSMGDVRFAFDSSFIAPAAAEEFEQLAGVRDDHKEELDGGPAYPPISIFGHADPVGNDDYNKQLSGRRARAVHAALTRDTAAWEQLYSQPYSGDNWGTRSVQMMLAELGFLSGEPTGSQDSATQDAVRAFQQQEGLGVDGVAGPQTREKLFLRYMDRLCGDLRLDKNDDFLARGADSGGKGDYQGCSEFNPVLMFSSAENDRFSDPARKDERDAQNAPNRRVVAFLFRPGIQVTPSKWPCPRATEGTAGCRRRFWSDAAERRSFQAERRVYENTRDTFACRFYDLMADQSPCERAVAVLRVRLHDALGNKMPSVQYQLEYAGRTKSGRADRQAFVSETLDPDAETCTVRWDPLDPDSPDSGFAHELQVFVPLLEIDSEDGIKRRLHNLGYPIDGEFEANLRAFQAHHGLEVTGQADDATKDKLRSIDRNALDEPAQPEQADPASAPDSEERT